MQAPAERNDLRILENDQQVDIPLQAQHQLSEELNRKDFKLGIGLGGHLAIQAMDFRRVQSRYFFGVGQDRLTDSGILQLSDRAVDLLTIARSQRGAVLGKIPK